jgi:hypothetical protein
MGLRLIAEIGPEVSEAVARSRAIVVVAELRGKWDRSRESRSRRRAATTAMST